MNNSFNRLFLMILLLALNTGCTISRLQHEGLREIQQTQTKEGALAIAKQANGLYGGKVGWGRITVFAIPVVPIYIKGDEKIQLMENIREALELSGYNVNWSDADSTAEQQNNDNAPVLTCRVDKIRFNNYTWLVPIVPTWGGIDVTLELRGEDQSVLWQQSFEGDGFTFNFFDGYNIASQESMSELLDGMVGAFTSDAFHQALTGGNNGTEDNSQPLANTVANGEHQAENSQ